MANIIERLHQCLAEEKLPESKHGYYGYFAEIAELLMNHCMICRGKMDYEITEIEFYLFNPAHKDVITYPREVEPGKWFFHQSGVDISFKSDARCYGGILLRGIREIHGDRKQIFGPQKCVAKLWDIFDAFEARAEDYPVIEEWMDAPESEILSFPRWIPLGKGKSRAERIDQWLKRIKREDVMEGCTVEDIGNLVFDSPYRFIKISSVERSAEAWKRYAAKPL